MNRGCIRPRPLEQRFWEKVQKSDGCWIWTGSKIARGYGRIYVNGALRPATQVSWEIENKAPWPKGMDACHHCDNPPCVRPDHLFPGTPSDNAKDSIAKGRLLPPQKIPGWRPHNKGHPTCKRGHKFSKENTIITSQGSRSCRTCQRAHQAKYDKKRRASAALGALAAKEGKDGR